MNIFQRFFRFKPTQTLYIIRGVSGSGKSTLAGHLSSRNVAADDFPGLYSNGSYDSSLQQVSHQWCIDKVQEWMKRGEPTIAVHNTFVKKKYYQSYLNLAAQFGYTVHIIHTEAVILPNGDRPHNVHGVPSEILKRQQSSWEAHAHD